VQDFGGIGRFGRSRRIKEIVLIVPEFHAVDRREHAETPRTEHKIEIRDAEPVYIEKISTTKEKTDVGAHPAASVAANAERATDPACAAGAVQAVMAMTDERRTSADQALDVQTVVVEESGRWFVEIIVVFADGVVRKRIHSHATQARAELAADLIRRTADRDIGRGPVHG